MITQNKHALNSLCLLNTFKYTQQLLQKKLKANEKLHYVYI